MADRRLSQELSKLKSNFGRRWDEPITRRRSSSSPTRAHPSPRADRGRSRGEPSAPSTPASKTPGGRLDLSRQRSAASPESGADLAEESSRAAVNQASRPSRDSHRDPDPASSTMSSQRSRNSRGPGRNGGGQGEEVQLWQQIREELRGTIDKINGSNDSARSIVAQESFISKNKTTANVEAEERKLEDLFRSSIRGTENVVAHIDEVKGKLEILSALQKAKELEAQSSAASGSSRAAGLHAGSGRNPSRTGGGRERERDRDPASLYEFDGAGDSPVPSPMGGHTRKLGGGASSDRSGNRDSVPPRGGDRDTPAKADSAEPQLPGAGPASAAQRSKVTFVKGQDVAFKPKPANAAESTDWYLGKVQQVLGEGKSRRYKVKDEDPDLLPDQRQEYRTSASSMIPIPPAGAELPELDKGKTVLALYPDSTTFYKAEVMGTDAATGKVNLRFEGEENSGTLQVVERRYVVEYRS